MPTVSVPDERLSELIGRLYDAALDDRLWSGMASHIAAAFHSGSAVVKLHGNVNVELIETTPNLVIAEKDRAWATHWHHNDLWVERSVAVGMSRVITSQDLVSPEEAERSDFYHDWLHKLDIHHMVGAVFPDAENKIGVLGIHRQRTAGRYTRADRQKFAALLPHLRRALKLSRRLAETSLAQRAALDTLDQLDSGVLVVDRARQVIHANRLAEALLRDTPDIGLAGGRLTIRQSGLDAQLGDMVRGNVDLAAGLAARPQQALAVPRDGLPALMLIAAPLRPSWSRLDGQRPLALIFMRDPGQPVLLAECLRGLFGLTPTEAMIAADLTHGLALPQIAKQRQMGLATVRSHVKSLLIKTGTNRQAELVALVLRSAPPLLSR